MTERSPHIAYGDPEALRELIREFTTLGAMYNTHACELAGAYDDLGLEWAVSQLVRCAHRVQSDCDKLKERKAELRRLKAEGEPT